MPLSRKLQDLKKEGFFTKKDLLDRLYKEGFFSNAVSLWKYEKAGIIKKPKKYHTIKNMGWEVRLYTQEEIDNIVTELKLLPIKTRLDVSKK